MRFYHGFNLKIAYLEKINTFNIHIIYFFCQKDYFPDQNSSCNNN